MREVIRSGATEFTCERTMQPRPKIDPRRSELDELLTENAGRPKRERLTPIRVYEELRNCGYRRSALTRVTPKTRSTWRATRPVRTMLTVWRILAHLAGVGFFREVRLKGFDSMLTRTLVRARNQLTRMTTQLSNPIRGVMKTFGLLVPAGKGCKFERNVRHLLADRPELASIVLPLLNAWRSIRTQVADLGTRLVTTARQSPDCRLLMSVPGVGAVTATSFVAAIVDPDNFRNSRFVGAWVGVTTRR